MTTPVERRRFEVWARLGHNMADDLAEDYPDLAHRFRELAELCADIAATGTDTDGASLPSGWRECTPRATIPGQVNRGTRGDMERDYPNRWTGLAGNRAGGYFWQLSAVDGTSVASATALSLAEAMAKCDAEWSTRVGSGPETDDGN